MKRTIMCCLLIAVLVPFTASAINILERPAKNGENQRAPAKQPAVTRDTLTAVADSNEEPAASYDPYDILNENEDYWYYDQFDQDAGDQYENRHDRGTGDERDSRSDQNSQGE